MKQLIAPVVIIVALIAFFVIIDRKEFSRHDNVQRVVQSGNRMTSRNQSVPVPETKLTTEAKPTVETKPIAETQPVTDPKPVTEANPKTDTKPAETKPVFDTIHLTELNSSVEIITQTTKNDLLPEAIPVVTPEDAEKLNEEAEKLKDEKAIFIAKMMEFENKGMDLVYDDRMKLYTTANIPSSFDEIFSKHGVVKARSEFLTRKIPYRWNIDYNSLKGNCDFARNEIGYDIFSPDGVLIINAPPQYLLNTITGISVELSSRTPETKVRVGIEELGMIRPGKVYIDELSGQFEDECINYEVSALEHYDCVRLFLEISGEVTIHRLRVFQKEIKGSTYLEGKITERSVLPDPKKSDYPNCRFTAHFEGNVICAGEACPQEMSLIIDGFKDFTMLKTDSLKQEDKIICSIIPYETLSEEEQFVQQADELNLFSLEKYYVLGVRTINNYTAGDNAALLPPSGIHFLDEKMEHVSIFDRHINPPVSQQLQEAQNVCISKDLDTINEMLKGYDDDKIEQINNAFIQAWKTIIASSGYNTVIANGGKYIWKAIDNSFFCINPNFSKLIVNNDISDENLDALVELKKALEANGVQLIVSVIQDRDSIVARIINKDFRNIVDYQTYKIMQKMLLRGIETITSSKEVIDRFSEEEFTYGVGGDGHPSVLTQKVLSEKLAKRLERYNLPKRLQRNLFSFDEVEHHFYGYDPMKNFPDNCDIGNHKPGDKIKVKKPILSKDHSYTNAQSEVLVVGNSFIVSPYSSNGLVSWLDYNLETDVSQYIYSENGPATVFIDYLLMDPDKYLKGKQVAIVQIALSHLLNVHWHNITQIDRQLCLLSSAKPVSTIPIQLQSNVDFGLLSDKQRTTIGQLKGHSFRITDNEFFIAKSQIATNKKSIIVIPACLISGNVSVFVNNNCYRIPSSFDDSKNTYQSLVFEIPNETSEVSISVTGESNSVFVIKDIEIWQ